MTKTEIITASVRVFVQLTEDCKNMDETSFFIRPSNKWSAAEHVQHLIISTNTTTLAYRLPAILVKWFGGTPNRNSRTYREIKDKYYKKLSEGGRASGRFVPKPIEVQYGKIRLLNNWNTATEKFIKALDKNRSEKDLDSYLVKHPLLGRITLRELCYFTIFHTEHHRQNIQKTVEIHDPVF